MRVGLKDLGNGVNVTQNLSLLSLVSRKSKESLFSKIKNRNQ